MADEFGNWTVGVDWDLTGFNKSATHVEKTLRKLMTLQKKISPTISPAAAKLSRINQNIAGGAATPEVSSTAESKRKSVEASRRTRLRLRREENGLIRIRSEAERLGISVGEKASSKSLIAMQEQRTGLTRLIKEQKHLNNITADKARVDKANAAASKSAAASSSANAAASVSAEKSRTTASNGAAAAAKSSAAASVNSEKSRTTASNKAAATAKANAAAEEAWLVRRMRMGHEIRKIENTINSKVKETHRSYGTLIDRVNQLKAASAKANSPVGLENYRQQMDLLKTSTAATTQEIARQNRAMNSQKFAANSLTSSMQNLARSYLSIFAAIEGGRAFFRTAVELDSIKASLIAVSGDADQAADDFEFLKSTSLELGVGLTTLSDGYRKIGIGARAANINLEDTREILLSGAEAATAFGLDAEQANLVLLAMGQIISKGRVSREELGRQMGEQFPAMIIGAKAMNMELAEFERLVESGGLSAEEFIVPFAKQLRETVRETGALQAGLESVRAEIGRFQGQMQIAVDEVFSGGMREATALIIRQLTDVFATFSPIIKTIGGAIVGLTIALSGILNGVGKVFAPLFEGVNIIVGKVAELLGLVSGNGDSLVTGFEALGVAIGVVLAMWTGGKMVGGIAWMVAVGLPKLTAAWKVLRSIMTGAAIAQAFATAGLSVAAGTAALVGVGLVAGVGAYSLYNKSKDTGNTTTSTDKSTNTTIEKLEVNVTAPAGADANQFGQSVADSMAASMGLSSAITN